MDNVDFMNYLTKKSCVFWDWNGTLLDDLDYSLGITNSILESKNAATLSKHLYQDIFTIPVSDYYNSAEFSKHGFTFEEMGDLYISNYVKNRDTVKLYKGSKNCLKTLEGLGVTQVLFSAAHISELQFQVDHHKIANYFEILSGAGDFHGGCKLERGRALQQEYSFTNAVMVGDTLHDVEIGKEIGFETIWVSDGHQSLKRAKNQSFIDYIFEREDSKFYKNT